MRGIVKDRLGRDVNYEAAENLMDDELRESIHGEFARTQQQFFDEYAKRHFAKFGEHFAPYAGYAW